MPCMHKINARPSGLWHELSVYTDRLATCYHIMAYTYNHCKIFDLAFVLYFNKWAYIGWLVFVC